MIVTPLPYPLGTTMLWCHSNGAGGFKGDGVAVVEATSVLEHGCVEFGVVDDGKQGVSQKLLELLVDLGNVWLVGKHVIGEFQGGFGCRPLRQARFLLMD